MCVGLEDLDICGCRGVTDKTVYALQESLLYMRGARRAQFVFAVGGEGWGEQYIEPIVL